MASCPDVGGASGPVSGAGEINVIWSGAERRIFVVELDELIYSLIIFAVLFTCRPLYGS